MAWVADAGAIAALVAPFVETCPMYEHSSDVSDAFLSTLIGDCHPGRLNCDPAAFLGVWLNESGLSARAQNHEALAAGFFQAMPAILRGLGFRGDAQYSEPPGAHAAAAGDAAKSRALDQALSDAFCRCTLEVQLGCAFKYYLPHAGKFVNSGACYAANFCPAWIGHAADAGWVICAKDGRSAGGLSTAQSEEWFRENAGLDVDGDGAITMGDLAAKAARAAATPRGQELVARVRALQGPSAADVAELQALASEPPDVEV